jgi:polyvinyl alcohol dehydrogenase (cytochrome)
MQMRMKFRNVSLPKAALLTVLSFVSALSAQTQSDVPRSGQWRSAGQNLANTRSQPEEHSINSANVKNLNNSGGAIWDHPTIDPKRGLLYVGTGNSYTARATVEARQDATPTAQYASPDDHFDSVMALDLKTGQIKWADGLQAVDTFVGLCTTCPVPDGPDFDFGGSGTNLVGNIAGIGQKSGIYWALNPDNGKIVWSTQVGPGGKLGGVEWGTAIVGKGIYVAISNNLSRAYTLLPLGQQITWGSWSALDVATGKVLWQTADPIVDTIDTGSVSVANGVMYAGSYSGQMYALDSTTGNILWNFASGHSVIDGQSIVNGVVYWGSGYGSLPPGTGNDKVYAFPLTEKDLGEPSDNRDHSGDQGKQD